MTHQKAIEIITKEKEMEKKYLNFAYDMMSPSTMTYIVGLIALYTRVIELLKADEKGIIIISTVGGITQ